MKNTFAKFCTILFIFLLASSCCYADENNPYILSQNALVDINSSMVDSAGLFYFTPNFDGEFNFELRINGATTSIDGILHRSSTGESDEIVSNGNKVTVKSGEKYYFRTYGISEGAIAEFTISSDIDASFETSTYDSYASEEDIYEKMRTKNAFEQIATEFFLSVGDYAQDYLSKTLKEEITIDKIVYNKVEMLNANFFNNSANPSTSSASDIVRTVITDWFNWFRAIALIIILMGLVVAGIKTMVGTAKGKTEALEIIKKVVMAVALVYLFPFVMRYAFDLNEAIIQQIYKNTHSVKVTLGTTISPVSDFQMDDIEERSPQYVSLAGLNIKAGSKEATELYLSKVETYARTADMMRILRAYAGVTERFMYVILWYIMLAQTYILAIIYIKRYIVIAFLTAIYPLVIIGYITGNLFGESQNAFNRWCGKYFTNIFLQTIHAITYGVISGIIMVQLQEAMLPQNGGVNNMNWLVMIIAVSFLFTGEKILARFWKASTTDADRTGIRGALGAPKKYFGMVKSLFGK